MMDVVSSKSGKYGAVLQSTDTIKVALLDEQPLFRLGLATCINGLPGFEIISETSFVLDFIEYTDKEEPDLLIMDIVFNGQSNIEIIREIRSRFSHLPILVLSDFEEVVFAKQVIRAGANGYIMKNTNADEVCAALFAVLEGRTYLSERVYDILLGEVLNQQEASSETGIDRLSAREFQVFLLMGKGLQPKEITNSLRLSRGTVEYDRKIMLKKLNFINLRQLRDFALSWVRSNRIN
jgi:DNA-binding NarL/FixJ family response regulator